MKDQHLKKISSWLAIASLFATVKASAVSFNDIQFWIGAGTNRAALVIEWSTPESTNFSTVPAPIADKSLVWGYRFNGTTTAAQMFDAIIAADSRLYAIEVFYPGYGASVQGIGFHLGGGGDLGITDGSVTNYFTNGLLTNATVYVDAASALNPGDLYWSGWNGPNWELWTELGDVGGFLNCPERGLNPHWAPDDANSPDSMGVHGQWSLNYGMSSLLLTNGSWIGFSVAAGEFEYDTVSPYFVDKHAPAQPDPTVTALVKNFGGGFQAGQWQAQFVSCTNWNYALERSTDLQSWATVTSGIPGNGLDLNLTDPAPPAGRAFYRVRAEQP